MPSENGLVKVRDVHKHFTRGSERIDVLKGVNLEIPKGDFLALMGPSGSGKTTLLNLIGGLDTPTGGAVDVDGVPVSTLSGSQLSKWRSQNIGFVFQLYNLLPVLTAEKNVELPLLLTKLSKAERKKRAGIALKVVGLAERAKHYPRQLSGGQEQRVGIARAIVTDPDAASVRRADGRPRSQGRRRDPRSPPVAQPRAGQDDCDGHARPARGRARPPDVASRKGRVDAGNVMKFIPLIWKNIWRRKFRTTFTLLSIFIAFVLFGILMTIRHSFSFGVEIAGADRLVLIHKISLIMPLPVSYQPRLQQTPGVEIASHQTWFGGIYQDPSNFFANIAVVPEPFLKTYPEFVLPPEQKAPGSKIARARSSDAIWPSDSAGRSAIASR